MTDLPERRCPFSERNLPVKGSISHPFITATKKSISVRSVIRLARSISSTLETCSSGHTLIRADDPTITLNEVATPC